MVDMAKSGTTLVKTQRIRGFYTVLTSAACEWFLIFLLLINAVISYLLTKFARYCDLQTPCVLCSRIDHVISGAKQKLEWYQYLVCSDHRSEISSLVSCHIHDKVSDGHGMCDECLMSIAPDDKTHSKTHRLLLGKLRPALGNNHGSQGSLPNRDAFTSSPGSKPCSCCGKFWNSMQSSQRSLLLNSPRLAVFKQNFHLPDIYRKNCRNQQNGLKKICDKPASCLARCCSDSLSNYAEYTEVKLASDSESEFAFSDDDDIHSLNHENIEARNHFMPQFTAGAPSKCLPSNSNPTKPHSISSETEPLILFPCVKPNVSNLPNVNSTVSEAVNNDYGFGEIKWKQLNQKPPSSELPELISLNEASPSSDVVDAPSQEPEESKVTCLSQNSLPAALSEIVTSNSLPQAATSPKKCADDTQASDTGGCSSKNHEESSEETVNIPRASTETAPSGNESAFSSRTNGESSNVNELPVTNEEREAPGFPHEHRAPTEVNGVNEEPKRSHSPSSSPRSGSSMSSVVPIYQVHAPEIQTNSSSSYGIQELQKAASLRSVLESLAGCCVSEIEGESIVDQLKRQVEHDKKCISTLYKELEEERSASATAANESMAMITRLQEEKAVLHMEALQYLRMMDEQAEYDGEELEKAYDLLAEKEKEIQDLEAELEFYRLNMEEEPMGHNMQKESCDLKGKNITVPNFSVPPITIFSNSKLAELSQVAEESTAHETSLEFEDEKLYISNCLSSLEKNLRRISDHGVSSSMPNDGPENFEESESDRQGSSNGKGPRLDSKKDSNVSSIKEDYNTSNGSITDQNGSSASKSEICSPSGENNHSVSVDQKDPMQRKNVDLVSIENEISDLNERLEALEADHDLLEHILHSLRDDNDGLQFIRHIAHQLHELRKLGSRIRW